MISNVICVFIGVAIGGFAAYKAFLGAERGTIKFCEKCPLIPNVEKAES